MRRVHADTDRERVRVQTWMQLSKHLVSSGQKKHTQRMLFSFGTPLLDKPLEHIQSGV